MPASHPSPANPGPPSVENPHHGAATKSSSVCCSSPLSLRSKAIPLPARTTTRNEPKANATTKPSSLWPDADPTSCSPCSETAPSTNRGQPTSLQRLDENDRSTPQIEMLTISPAGRTTSRSVSQHQPPSRRV